MNKAQAAEFLQIGVRSLERYMAAGRIAYTRQRGKTGDQVEFNQQELERFRHELHQPTHQAAVELRQEPPSINSGIVTSSQIMAELGEIKLSLGNMIEGIDSLVEVLKEFPHRVPVHTKPLLTLGEAQKFTGLGRPFLLRIFDTGV